MQDNYKLDSNIRDNDSIRNRFNRLSQKTFQLSFEEWYREGFWTDKYIPYVLLDGEQVIANISVNIIDTIWHGQPKRYIQLGTVMTDEEYRNKGLSRFLMETILLEWKNKCDAVYLFANDTVLDFYPKFGFTKETEYQCSIPFACQGHTGKFRKLDMMDKNDIVFLKSYYDKSNPFSELPMVHNFGLLMFYCKDFLRDCVYYCEELDVLMIAKQEDSNLICYDIYCEGRKDITEILKAFAGGKINRVLFDFTPKDASMCETKAIAGEDTLFVLKEKENIFSDSRLMFPILSHA